MLGIFTKRRVKITLSDITVFDFKKCYEGDLSPLKNDSFKWNILDELYQEATNSKGVDLPLELRIQIAMKENTVIMLNCYLFIMRNSFESFLNSLNDKYYLKNIEYCGEKLIEYGIKFNRNANIVKEHNRCVKLVQNKRNDIQVDVNDLKESTKGGITFGRLIAIVSKFSNGAIKPKESTMDEFVEFYNLMIDGKRN